MRLEGVIKGSGRVVAAMLVGASLLAGQAVAAGPSLMPGFPMRAGENVMLMWLPLPGATEYNVYRSEKPGGPYQKVGGGPANNFMDPGAPASKTYYYVVKGVVGGKEGDPSTEASIKGIEPMVPPKMGGFLATADNKITIRWENNPKAIFYNLYKSETEKGDLKLLTSVQDTKYTDSNVQVGKAYYYATTAVNAANVESPKSEKMLAKIEPKVEQKVVSVVYKPVEPFGYYDSDEKVVLRGPGDIAVDDQGRIYVTDGIGAIQVIRPEGDEFKFVQFIGDKPPTGFAGNWTRPTGGLFLDRRKKELYACYTDASTVRVFGLDGAYLRGVTVNRPDPKNSPKQGWDPSPLDAALGIDGLLWVTDGAYYQLLAFNEKGEEVRRIGLPREHPDREKPGNVVLWTPNFLAVNPKNGDIYVMEGLTQRVSAFDKDGKFLRHIGRRGTGPGMFQVPNGLATDEDGRLYAGDRNMEKVQLFDEKGEYLATLRNPAKKDPEESVRIGLGLSGLAVDKKMLYCSSLTKERVSRFKLTE